MSLLINDHNGMCPDCSCDFLLVDKASSAVKGVLAFLELFGLSFKGEGD